MIHKANFTLIRDGLGRKYWYVTCTCAIWEVTTASYEDALKYADFHEWRAS